MRAGAVFAFHLVLAGCAKSAAIPPCELTRADALTVTERSALSGRMRGQRLRSQARPLFEAIRGTLDPFVDAANGD